MKIRYVLRILPLLAPLAGGVTPTGSAAQAAAPAQTPAAAPARAPAPPPVPLIARAIAGGDSVKFIGVSGTLSRMAVVGNTVYLSGVLGTRAGPGVAEQAKLVMETIRTSLAEVGATMDDIVHCTVYMADLSERPAFNEVYSGFFTTSRPTRSAVGVDLGGPRVEVECTAVLPRRA